MADAGTHHRDGVKSPTEELVQQLVTADFLMGGNVGEDCGQCADSQRIVNGDGDMMLGRAGGFEPQMTARVAL